MVLRKEIQWLQRIWFRNLIKGQLGEILVVVAILMN